MYTVTHTACAAHGLQIDAYNCLFQDPFLEEWLTKEPEFARGELEAR